MTDKEKKVYEGFLDRISVPTHPVPLSEEECETYNAEHPLPTEKELSKILKEAGVI